MSHPNPAHDPENVRTQDSHWSKREQPSSAKGKAIKGKIKSKRGMMSARKLEALKEHESGEKYRL